MFDPQTTRPVAAMAVLLGQPETSNVTMLFYETPIFFHSPTVPDLSGLKLHCFVCHLLL